MRALVDGKRIIQHDLRLPFELLAASSTSPRLEVGNISARNTRRRSCIRSALTPITCSFPQLVRVNTGQNHINCQWPAYWQALFNQSGFWCDDRIRWEIWTEADIEPWYRQRLHRGARSARGGQRAALYARPSSANAAIAASHRRQAIGGCDQAIHLVRQNLRQRLAQESAATLELAARRVNCAQVINVTYTGSCGARTRAARVSASPESALARGRLEHGIPADWRAGGMSALRMC